MLRSLCFSLVALTTFALPHAADAKTFAMSTVTAAIPRDALGTDAGIDVTGGRYVRLTASGSIQLGAYGACARSVGPRGCSAAISFARLVPSAPTGTLVATFVDRGGTPVTAWAAVGDASYVAVPSRASRMLLRINGANVRDPGRFHVAADVVASEAATDASAQAVTVHRLSVGRQVANAGAFTRAQAQHLLRRFAFSGSPIDVTNVYASGPATWLATQLSPATIDDSALANYMQSFPTYTGNPNVDYLVDTVVSRRITQRQIATQRQLLEKMTLYWLEHFAVSESKVNDPGAMGHYEDTVRADALGNFAQLVSDVSVEPAMLIWLDNNYNNGSNPASDPPNENFGRELMQLYTVGPSQLNPDGSTVVDSTGAAVPVYGEPDVKAIALALTGFEVHEAPNPVPTGVDPRTFDSVSFASSLHANGPFTIVNQRIVDPGNATIVNAVVKMLAHLPTTAPFEVKELLQRVAADDPSPAFVARISAVWTATVDDPNQIAKVVAAIANDPEFYADEHALVKEPIEFGVDAVRGLAGATQSPLSAYPNAFDLVRSDVSGTGQSIFYAPTVFSFYRPGDKESLLSNTAMLGRWNEAVDVSNRSSLSAAPACSNNCPSYFINLGVLKGKSPVAMSGALCDALVDGGTPELRQLVQTYLTANPTNISGAIWIIMTSPEYEVN